MAPNALAQVLCHLPKFNDPNLIVGIETGDDASVYKLRDDLAIIQTVDIFPPVVDDPFDYGMIAAANSLSDIYAMGAEPKLAMNVLCLPEDLSKEETKAILAGGYEKVAEANAIITGGHTIKDNEPKYGLSVTGFSHPKDILKNCGAKPGDILILTKGLGTGILTTAIKANLITKSSCKIMTDSMSMLNKKAAEIINQFKSICLPNACTDVTGFGLGGHAFEMAEGSGASITLLTNELPILPEAEEMAKMGIIPQGAYGNREWLKEVCKIEHTAPVSRADLIFDPQTSGGLLISIPEKHGLQMLSLLQDKLPMAKMVGFVEEYKDYSLYIK